MPVHVERTRPLNRAGGGVRPGWGSASPGMRAPGGESSMAHREERDRENGKTTHLIAEGNVVQLHVLVAGTMLLFRVTLGGFVWQRIWFVN